MRLQDFQAYKDANLVVIDGTIIKNRYGPANKSAGWLDLKKADIIIENGVIVKNTIQKNVTTITISGPAGSGKSTIAEIIQRALHAHKIAVEHVTPITPFTADGLVQKLLADNPDLSVRIEEVQTSRRPRADRRWRLHLKYF